MDLFPMHSWHPIVIHFPLVALLLAVTLDVVGALIRSVKWRDAATLLWWVGMAGAVAAVATGLIAYDRVDHSELAHDAMLVHRNLAFAAATVLLATAVWRWRRPASRLRAAVGVVGLGLLLAVGYLGGELVFRHALGVPTETLEQISHERGSEAHHHGQTVHDDGHDTSATP